jgi:hypothetical protein
MTEQGAIITLARYTARKRIKEDWLAQGAKLSEITAADVVWWAEALIAEHPEMLDQAKEMIRQSPERSPGARRPELRRLIKYHK